MHDFIEGENLCNPGLNAQLNLRELGLANHQAHT
jgi:hypothetical protein